MENDGFLFNDQGVWWKPLQSSKHKRFHYWCQQVEGKACAHYHIQFMLLHWKRYPDLQAGLQRLKPYQPTLSVDKMHVYLTPEKDASVENQILQELGWKYDHGMWIFDLPYGGGDWLMLDLASNL